jgi:hypothetical protein
VSNFTLGRVDQQSFRQEKARFNSGPFSNGKFSKPWKMALNFSTPGRWLAGRWIETALTRWNPIGSDGTGRHQLLHVSAIAGRANRCVGIRRKNELFKLVTAGIALVFENWHDPSFFLANTIMISTTKSSLLFFLQKGPCRL